MTTKNPTPVDEETYPHLNAILNEAEQNAHRSCDVDFLVGFSDKKLNILFTNCRCDQLTEVVNNMFEVTYGDTAVTCTATVRPALITTAEDFRLDVSIRYDYE